MLELIMIVWLAVGAVGLATLFIFMLSLIIGGLYDLHRLWADHREEGRRSRGLCARCGYDLRCSHRCCPECGLPLRTFPHPRCLHT